MNIKQLLLTTLIATMEVSAWAQTNATSITAGGYYRMYSPKSKVYLYANGEMLKKDQPSTGDHTDIFQFSKSDDNYTIKCVGKDGYYINGFKQASYSSKSADWVNLTTTSTAWQVTHYSSSSSYSTAWTIGEANASATDEKWMNYNDKGAVLKWKVVNNSTEDENSYFYLYPCEKYTLSVTGGTDSDKLTCTNNGLTSVGRTEIYFDGTTPAQSNFTAPAGYAITAFNVSEKTITITLTDTKTQTISNNHGDATSLLTSADCTTNTGWSNSPSVKTSQKYYTGNATVLEPTAGSSTSQTITGLPNGTYTVQLATRGTSTDKVKLTLNSTDAAEVTLAGGDNQSGNVSAEKLVSSSISNNGWILLQGSATVSDGNLAITISHTKVGSSNWWQISDVKVLLNADENNDATYTYKTKITSGYMDLTTTNHHYVTISGNALVKASANSGNLPNVIVGDACASLKLTDGAYDFSTTAAFTATSLSYDRTLTANNASTVCLPFALTAEEAAAIGKFYTLKSYASENLTFEEVTAGTEAYKPYLLVPTATAFSNYSSKSIAATPATLAQGGVTGADFVGTLTAQTLKSDGTHTLYGYNGNGTFVKVGSTYGAKINPFHAYISIPGTSSARPRSLSIRFGDGETTDISEGVTVDDGQSAAPVYNLNGQRVSQPAKGIYIVNGKKVIIK